MCVTHIPFVIPRQIEDVRKELRSDFERTKRIILRMDEYLVSSEEKSRTKRLRRQNISHGLHILAEAVRKLRRLAFREVLIVDEALPISDIDSITEDYDGYDVDNNDDGDGENSSIDTHFYHEEKIQQIIDFQSTNNLIEFDRALYKHQMKLLQKPVHRLSDMIYLKFCLVLEIQRDEHESCLRLLLHDIIFKYNLSDFHLRCEIHVRKPIEHELTLEKSVHEERAKPSYSAELMLWSGDWIVQQEVELYVVIKIESLSINKYICAKFWDMAHLHVKYIPYGASRIFLRELTPISRPHKIMTHGSNVGQVEIEAEYFLERHQLAINIVKVNHLQPERLSMSPETYVEVIFQNPFYIYDTKRTKKSDRSYNPIFDEEFLFQLPNEITISDVTIDLIFIEKSSLHYHPVVLGVLTLSKHTDWFPVRKFWADIGQNPDIRIKDRFLFEGSIYD